MNQHYEYTPSIWLPFATVFLLIGLFIYSFRHRSVPGALPFAIGSLFTALWAVGSAMEYAAVDLALKIAWVKFQAVWQLPAVTAITCFVLEYVWPGRWLTRRHLVLLSIVPLLTLGLILTNDLHHLAWRSFGFSREVIQPRLGPGNWIAIAYGYVLNTVNIVIFARLYMRSPQQREVVVIMLTGLTGGLVIYLLEKVYILHEEIPFDMLGVTFVFLTFALVLSSFRILDPILLARRVALEPLRAGMLVLDPQGRVISLNGPAEHILQVLACRAKGRPIRELLPAYPDTPFTDARGIEVELSLGMGQDLRYYTMTISLLKDWRGLEVGSLLILRDMTERKQIHMQIIEQQQALATLQERERLARELHDSLGQVLGYASLQLEAVAKLSRDGQVNAVAAHLDRLASVIHEAHADVREYILNLRTAPSAQRPFLTVVQQYLESFTCNYDIPAHLTIGPGINGRTFSPDVQLQLLRIVQEALANARKHSQARHIQVSFDAEDGRVCMIIQDDGRGFSPDHMETNSGKHFGLMFMQERALLLGGSLQIQSTPGKGTRLVLAIPEKEL